MMRYENISFSYGNERVLNQINTTFGKERITTIVGPNGCGKSTLLKAGAGLLKPSAGTVYLNDTDIKKIHRKEYARKVSILFQHYGPKDITVESYICSGRYPYQRLLQGLTKQDDEMINWSMKLTGCSEFRKKQMCHLSGGERQKVFIAMAIAQDTDIILLDEPTTYLDINVSYEIMELLKMLNRTHRKTIVMVLHDLNLALQYSDTIILMEKGRIVTDFEVEKEIPKEAMNRIFHLKMKRFTDDGKHYYCFDQESDVISSTPSCF